MKTVVVSFISFILLFSLTSCSINKSEFNNIYSNASSISSTKLRTRSSMSLIDTIDGENYYAITNLGTDKNYENVLFNEPDGTEIIVNYPEWIYGSNNTMVFDNKYYEWIVDKEGMKLLSIDLSLGKVVIVDKKEEATIYADFFVINNNQFLSFYSIKVPSEIDNLYKIENVVDLYSTNGFVREIYRSEYVNYDFETNSTGSLIEGFFSKNNELFAITREKEDNKYHFFVNTFDLDGSLKKEEEIENLGDIIGDEGIAHIDLKNNIIVIKTLNDLKTKVIKYDNEAQLLKEGYIDYGLANTDDYIVLAQSNVDDSGQIEEESITLEIMNVNTGESISNVVSLQVDMPYFVGMKVLSNGNVMIQYCNGKYDPLKIEHSIIKRKDLANYINMCN